MVRVDAFWIETCWPGRLAIVPRPRGGDWLADDVAAWKVAGVNVVVCCLTPDENTELRLTDEAAICIRHGLKFISFPIPDRGVPASRESFNQLLVVLLAAVERVQTIAVHCRQGIGRSALVVASLLVLAGETPDQAFRKIEHARGMAAPDTAEQRRWVSVVR